MNDIVYNLLLTGELGFSLAAILRYRAVAATADTLVGTPPATDAPLQALPIELIETPLQGTLVAPLLTGSAPVPLRGVLYSTAAGPLAVVLFNTGTPPVSLQFSFVVAGTIAGGLNWQAAPGTPVSALYSLLGRRVA